ncbi:MAG: hypothetical protein PWQ28_49 [Candidatus Woesearchaeota archaeon]|nr:hypothetical protein [Candidatus Woesearchaeota archaeon]
MVERKKRALFKRINNRTLLILVVALLLTTFFSQFLIINSLFEKSAITGLSFSSGEIRMCVLSEETAYEFERPKSYGVMRKDESGNYMLNLSKVTAPFQSEYNFTYLIKYSILEEDSILLGQYEAPQGSAFLTPSIHIADLEDRNCEYSLYYYSNPDEECSNIANVEHISIDNNPLPPIWETYKNENSTNFSQYNSPPDFWTAITNAKIYHPLYGSLNFTPYTLNFDSANLDEGIVFSQNKLNFSEKTSHCLNFPAYLEFRNISMYYPLLMRNGIDCISSQECYFISYNKTEGIYRAYIPGFGEYELVENATVMLEIWDDNDEKGGMLNKTVGESVNFFANLTAENETVVADGVFCNYSIYDSYENQIAYGDAIYNSSSALYEFNHTFDSKGIYTWKVFCSADALDLGNATAVDDIEIKFNPVIFSHWTDLDESGGIQIKYSKQPVGFYSVYLDAKTKEPINKTTSNCTLFLNNLSQGRWVVDENSTSLLMEYSNETEEYETTFTFQYPGEYPYSIVCQDYPYHENGTGSGVVSIKNRLPVLIANISNVTIQQGFSTTFVDLDNHFIDPDGELITFSSSFNPYLNVFISEDNRVTIIAGTAFEGNTTLTFFAQDYTQIKVPSNEITVFVLPSQYKNDTEPSTSSSEGEPGYIVACRERWVCSDWSQCYPDGYMYRTCVDMNNCDTLLRRPKLQMECNYTGTCFDGIQNQGEEGVDCGGPCSPCPSCFDGIQNQGEEGIDCGGPCSPCPSCFDGIQNQGEEGIDCGGPCPPCGILEAPMTLRTPLEDYLTEISMISALFMAIMFFLLNFFNEIKNAIKRFFSYIKKIVKSYSSSEISIVDIEDYLLKNLDKIQNEVSLSENKSLLAELTRLYRFFIKYVFNLRLEFTIDELKEFLRTQSVPSSKKTIYIAYLKALNEKGYSNEEISNETIERFISQFKKIIETSRDLISKADLLRQEEEIIKRLNLFPWRRRFLNKKLRIEIESHIYKNLAFIRTAIGNKDSIGAAEEYELARILVYLLPKKYRKKFISSLANYHSEISEMEKTGNAQKSNQDKNEAKNKKKNNKR